MSYILFQRNYLVIHSSSISIDGNASLFIGDSGKGKSSLAYTFFKKGCDLISEDFSYIYLNNNVAVTSYSHPLIKLNDKIAKGKNLNKIYSSDLDPLKRSIYKIDSDHINKEYNVKNLFFIGWGSKKIEEINTLDTLKNLFQSTVRYLPPEKFPEIEQNLLNITSNLIGSTKSYTYTRKKGDISDQYNDLINYIN